MLLIFGITVVGISLCHIAVGPSVIPGSIPVNATMDSEDRFYAVFFLAYGAAVLWCLKDWPSKLREIQLLMALFFVDGLTRVISMAVVGLPTSLLRSNDDHRVPAPASCDLPERKSHRMQGRGLVASVRAPRPRNQPRGSD